MIPDSLAWNQTEQMGFAVALLKTTLSFQVRYKRR